MYETFWNLNQRPFENTHQEAFYYPSESAQAAMLKLRYAVENRRGAAILAGPSGLGKSLLARTLLSQLPGHFTPQAHVVFPRLPSPQLIPYLLLNLGFAGNVDQLPDSLSKQIYLLQQVLAKNTKAGQHAVIIVDEAHLITDFEVLEALRLITNFETNGQLDLTLILIGQTQLVPSIERLPSFDNRVGVKSLMKPFTADETASYVTHRLRTAGREEEIFTADGLERLHELTRGNPRQINRLCDLALLIGFAEEIDRIDGTQLESIQEELVSVVPE